MEIVKKYGQRVRGKCKKMKPSFQSILLPILNWCQRSTIRNSYKQIVRMLIFKVGRSFTLRRWALHNPSVFSLQIWFCDKLSLVRERASYTMYFPSVAESKAQIQVECSNFECRLSMQATRSSTKLCRVMVSELVWLILPAVQKVLSSRGVL